MKLAAGAAVKSFAGAAMPGSTGMLKLANPFTARSLDSAKIIKHFQIFNVSVSQFYEQLGLYFTGQGSEALVSKMADMVFNAHNRIANDPDFLHLVQMMQEGDKACENMTGGSLEEEQMLAYFNQALMNCGFDESQLVKLYQVCPSDDEAYTQYLTTLATRALGMSYEDASREARNEAMSSMTSPLRARLPDFIHGKSGEQVGLMDFLRAEKVSFDAYCLKKGRLQKTETEIEDEADFYAWPFDFGGDDYSSPNIFDIK